MLKLKPKKTNYCTCWPEGTWSDCCYIHDEQSLLAYEYESAEMRLKADQELYDCVKSRGLSNQCQTYVLWSKTLVLDQVVFNRWNQIVMDILRCLL